MLQFFGTALALDVEELGPVVELLEEPKQDQQSQMVVRPIERGQSTSRSPVPAPQRAQHSSGHNGRPQA